MVHIKASLLFAIALTNQGVSSWSDVGARNLLFGQTTPAPNWDCCTADGNYVAADAAGTGAGADSPGNCNCGSRSAPCCGNGDDCPHDPYVPQGGYCDCEACATCRCFWATSCGYATDDVGCYGSGSLLPTCPVQDWASYGPGHKSSYGPGPCDYECTSCGF
jgi:hypothetical protein